MLSICTPTHNTPAYVLARTWASLKRQTLRPEHWEWVIYDDSSNQRAWLQLYGICSDERYNVRVYKSNQPTGGNIGAAKRNAFMLAHGKWLVELDHDDELTPNALEEIHRTIQTAEYEPIFLYSDWCEIDSNGASTTYPEGWGQGFGTTKKTNIPIYGEVYQHSIDTSHPDHLTHIVSIPNHVRVWNADRYRHINGHDPSLTICDDYDLYLRTLKGICHFKTYIQHIPKLLYIQHTGPHTQQRKRNHLIQKLVPKIYEKHYPERMKKT